MATPMELTDAGATTHAADAAAGDSHEKTALEPPGTLARDANFKFTVYRALRKAIVEGRLAPGTRLVEASLATQFGISKTPVREALVMLQADDLVTMRPHQG